MDNITLTIKPCKSNGQVVIHATDGYHNVETSFSGMVPIGRCVEHVVKDLVRLKMNHIAKTFYRD